MANSDQDIVKEFTGFAKELERIGVEYSIVVSVDKRPTRHHSVKAHILQPMVSNAATPARQARSEGD